MARTIGLWAFGLLASAIFGGLIGETFPNRDGGFLGMVGGPLAFACARLWLAESRVAHDPS